MSTFSLRELLRDRPVVQIGDLTLTDFRNDGSTIGPQFIFLDTLEGSNPGIVIRVVPPVTSTDLTQQIGIDFRINAPTQVIEGASVSLDGFGFGTPGAGGQINVDLTQSDRDIDNIGINLIANNESGGNSVLQGTDDITGGPVARFPFEYDMVLDPNNGISATFSQSTILFDLIGGPSPGPTIDGLQYIASYGDLIPVLGADAAAGQQHFLQFGQAEGREPDTFDENQYLANYADLQAAFGTDTQAATIHYITTGFFEGRIDDQSPPPIDGLQYIASYDDLIPVLGADAAAGQQHFLQFGQAEGREPDTFDENQYLANYADLQAAFGTDTQAATIHYITTGFFEGRVDEALV